jgi:hypothetical protein
MKKEALGAGQELDDIAAGGVVEIDVHQGRHHLDERQRIRGQLPAVVLVAHAFAASRDVAEVQAAEPLDHVAHHRGQDAAHPLQPLGDFRRVETPPQGFGGRSFLHRAASLGAGMNVLGDQDRVDAPTQNAARPRYDDRGRSKDDFTPLDHHPGPFRIRRQPSWMAAPQMAVRSGLWMRSGSAIGGPA